MPATAYQKIALDLTPPAARLRLQNPPLNVIDIPMMTELTSAMAEVESRPEISVLVIEGAGKAFSAGVSVADHTREKISQMLTGFHAIFRALVATKKVTVAQVHGHCLGGGAELAMICDLVYTAEDATWGFPEIKLACYPPVAATAMAALIGQKAAAELILTGRSVTGREAAALGLANRAVPQDQLQATVESTLAELGALSPAALAVTKKAIYAWDSMHFDKGLARAEKIYLEELMRTEDAAEGVASFLEKRRPQWKGR